MIFGIANRETVAPVVVAVERIPTGRAPLRSLAEEQIDLFAVRIGGQNPVIAANALVVRPRRVVHFADNQLRDFPLLVLLDVHNLIGMAIRPAQFRTTGADFEISGEFLLRLIRADEIDERAVFHDVFLLVKIVSFQQFRLYQRSFFLSTKKNARPAGNPRGQPNPNLLDARND